MELFAPVQELVRRSWNIFVNFVVAIFVFVLGWLVAKLIKAVVVKVLKTLRLDSISEQTRIAEFLSKGGIKHTLSEIIGMIIYWILILGVLISSLNILTLTGVSGLLDRVLGYLPNVLGAVVILIMGVLISALVASIVRTAVANVGFVQANVLGKVAQVAIIVFTIIIALDALKIAKVLISAMNIVLGAIGLAAALAFGLGCKDIAADFIADIIAKLKKK
jgi:hypothetical protein